MDNNADDTREKVQRLHSTFAKSKQLAAEVVTELKTMGSDQLDTLARCFIDDSQHLASAGKGG